MAPIPSDPPLPNYNNGKFAAPKFSNQATNYCSKYSAAVQRVVITSSVAAVIQPADHQQTLTEKDWNELSIREVNAKGREATPLHKYRASKALAEKCKPCQGTPDLQSLTYPALAAWEFVEKHKHDIKWDITAINPPLVGLLGLRAIT